MRRLTLIVTGTVAAIVLLAVAVYLLSFSTRQDTPDQRADSLGQLENLDNVSAKGGLNFAVVGDTGTGGEEQAAVAGLLERMKPGFVLLTGDVVYPNGGYGSYGPNFFTPYRELLKTAPILPALGNHDVATRNGEPYLDTFKLPHNNPQNTERYYSFDKGNAHFVSLDSELYHDNGAVSTAAQKAWLARDLASTDKPWKFVYLHRPLYSSSEHGSDLEIRKDLEPVLARNEVDIVFSGHDHDYERTEKIKSVTYVVTGGGGRGLYEAGKSNWTAVSASEHNAVKVSLQSQDLHLEALRPDGRVLDRLDLHNSP
jgi:3',5'-cyclic AMP phosphodiesterase CpdA